jgi:hypothetical protein
MAMAWGACPDPTLDSSGLSPEGFHRRSLGKAALLAALLFATVTACKPRTAAARSPAPDASSAVAANPCNPAGHYELQVTWGAGDCPAALRKQDVITFDVTAEPGATGFQLPGGEVQAFSWAQNCAVSSVSSGGADTTFQLGGGSDAEGTPIETTFEAAVSVSHGAVTAGGSYGFSGVLAADGTPDPAPPPSASRTQCTASFTATGTCR